MISSTLLLVLGGCVLGVVQLLAGIGIGMWLRRVDRAAAHRGRQDLVHAGLIAKRLQALTVEVSTSVGQHSSQLDEAAQLLTADDERSRESLAGLVVGVIDDVVRANQGLQSKLETAERKLREQAVEIEAHISRSLTDPLTGLPNRREFGDRLAARMGAWERRKEAFSLLLLDVDHFKRLNDQNGHLIGDQVLAGIGRALQGSLRKEDSVARYGGEEFAVLLPSTSLDQAAIVAEKVRTAISRVEVDHNGQRISVTASGGVAMIQADEKPDSLIQRADAALYAAKEAGRNCAFLHDGNGCRPAGGNPLPNDSSTLPANNPIAENGPPRQPDEISTELAETCEELRRFVAEQDQQQPRPARGRRS
jgi:diguanylate cyclase